MYIKNNGEFCSRLQAGREIVGLTKYCGIKKKEEEKQNRLK